MRFGTLAGANRLCGASALWLRVELEACQRGWSPWGWSESAFSEEKLLDLAHLPKNEFNYAHMHFQKNVALGLGLRVESFSFQLFWCSPKP